MRSTLLGLALIFAFGLMACGSHDVKGGSILDPSAPYAHGSDGTLQGVGGLGGQAGASSRSSNGFSPANPLGGFFRYGINAGFPNPSWNDGDLAKLEALRGCNSQRVSLPETHLDRWGLGIELADLATYSSLGLTGHVGFLTSPTRPHSTAPASAAEWELVHYVPRNLYEPILLDDGSINPDNYWGSYVYQTVKTYKDLIKIWEIWNEPDWVSDWQVTEAWRQRAPVAADLPRFNGSIYDYVRMLRVSKVAAGLADPDAKIATGGIGYPSFLGAILRYTDNPVDGTATTKYPTTGGDYLDVLSFHHYPVYTKGSSDLALDGYLEQVERLSAEVTQAGASIDGWENTETGAPHAPVAAFPGGDEYAVNYLLKVMTQAQARGIDGVDWFVLSDAKAVEFADDPYQLMGLYLPVADLRTTDEAEPTSAGIAYKTLATFLSKANYDPAATAALALTESLRGAAFQSSEGRLTLVLWARATGADETATGSLPSSSAFIRYDWDYARTLSSTSVATGQPLQLTASPRIFVKQD